MNRYDSIIAVHKYKNCPISEYDLLINYRYGTAIFNRETDKINIWSLYEIGKYCDAVDSDGRFVGLPDGRGGLEPRFSFNQTLKEDRQAFDIIKDIAKSMKKEWDDDSSWEFYLQAR